MSDSAGGGAAATKRTRASDETDGPGGDAAGAGRAGGDARQGSPSRDAARARGGDPGADAAAAGADANDNGEGGSGKGKPQGRRGKKRRLSPEAAASAELMRAVVEGAKRGDAAAALRAFHEARGRGVKAPQQCYNTLVHLCVEAQPPLVDDGTRVWEDMAAAGVRPTEPGLSGMIKLASNAGRLDEAAALLAQLRGLTPAPAAKAGGGGSDARDAAAGGAAGAGGGGGGRGDAPRLRSFAPLLAAYAAAGRRDDARALYAEIVERGLDPTEPEFAALLAADAAAGDTAAGIGVLRDMMELVYVPAEATREAAQRLFDADPAWKTAVVDVTREGHLPPGVAGSTAERPATLRSLTLAREEIESMSRETEALASGGKRRKRQFEEFKRWLDRNGPFDVIIDGANIGYLNQNFAGGHFRHAQVEHVVRAWEARGKRVLLVLHSKWFGKAAVRASYFVTGGAAPGGAGGEGGGEAESQISDGGEDVDGDGAARAAEAREREAPALPNPADMSQKAICDGWRERGVVFEVQPGTNDDWYWLYAAVRAGPKAIVVSNDQCRDHRFAMLAPRHFMKFRERHQAFPFFHNSRDQRRLRPGFVLPRPYSHRVHASAAGDAWFVPVAPATSGQSSRWLVAWREGDAEGGAGGASGGAE